MLNTVHLRTFLAVVDAGNYTAAAEYLHMSQPSVSMHIRSLEDQLGDVRLFRRVGQRMIPTHAGEELLAAAREIITISERTEQNIRSLRGQITGRILIGCTSNSGEVLLPPLLALFLIQFPEVSLDVRVAPGEVLLDALNAQHISIILIEEQQRRRGWDTIFLGNEELVLLAPPGHTLARQQQEIGLEVLREERLILPAPTEPLRRTIEEGLRRRGVIVTDMRVPVEVTTIAMMLQGVQEGIGLAFVPRLCVPDNSPLHRLKFYGSPLKQEWYLLRSRARGTPRAIQEFHLFLTSPTAMGLLAKQGISDHNEK